MHGRLDLVKRLVAVAWCVLAAAASVAAAQNPVAGRSADTSITIVLPSAGPLHEAWQALEANELDRAGAILERARRAEARNPLVHLLLGLVAYRRGQAANAEEALSRALELAPGMVPAALVLGDVLYERGDLAGAIRTYEAALSHAPGETRLTARLDRWRREASVQERFFQAQGSHFTVLFEGPAEEDLARRAIEVLEAAYNRIATTLLTFPSDPITVVFYTRDQFRDITRSPQWSGGVFDGRIRVPVQGAMKDLREFERVLTHEFVHALVHSVAPRRVPTWLNEGLAGYFEPGGIEYAGRAARMKTHWLHLADLAGSFGALPAADVELAYAESTLAVKAMVERTDGLAVMALLADLAAGTPFNEAFVLRIHVPFADFERELAPAEPADSPFGR
jgi:hypothetical protein